MQFNQTETKSLVMFAGIVAMKLRDDYNISFDYINSSRKNRSPTTGEEQQVTCSDWLWGMLHNCWIDGFDTSTCAFRIANDWQQHDVA